MKNLVIVVQVFPPSKTIGARRFGEISPYLEEFGYRPWVITMKSPGHPTNRIPQNQVIEIGEYRRGELKEARWAADIAMIRKIEAVGFRPIYFDPSLWYWARKVWQDRAQIRSRIGKIDFIVGSFGPPSALWLAKNLAQNWQVPWLADFRDLGALRKNNRFYPVRQIDTLIEREWLRSCSGLTTVSPTFADLFKSAYDKPCEVIFNGYDSYLFSTPNLSTPHPDLRPPYIHFAGQIYPNQVDSFKITLRAAKRLKDVQFAFRILGPRHIEAELIQFSKELGLGHQVLFLEPTDPAVASQESSQSVANLVVAQMYEPSRGTVPAKVFGLLPLKPPILGVGPDDSDVGNIIRKTKKGALCRTEDEVVDFVERALRDANAFIGDGQGIAEFSRRNQTKKLARFIDEILAKKQMPRSKTGARGVRFDV